MPVPVAQLLIIWCDLNGVLYFSKNTYIIVKENKRNKKWGYGCSL